MKSSKYFAIMLSIMALALLGCGPVEETPSENVIAGEEQERITKKKITS